MRNYLKVAGYLFARAGALLLPWRPYAIVLMYHAVDASGWRWSVSPAMFERQMRFLAKHRTVVPLADVVAFARGERMLPKNAVAITFDDGYKDTRTVALPILERYHLPATLFLTSALARKDVLHGLERPSWDDVRALHASGLVSIEVHGRTHTRLTDLAPDSDEFRSELIGCADDVEREVGVRPTLVAYPFGEKTTEIAAAVRDLGFEAAFGTYENAVHTGSNIYALPRVSVEHDMSWPFFVSRTSRAVPVVARWRTW